ncbi:hypothetical protein FJQ98_20570 [Lysinibacillus agricola]|uniref:Uncharacterized protein n=1 Tax=Lysinibacillus agricola TaxID=2590012 RepID=A0ABX7ANP3_9BACI|nr:MULTISPECIES: hypothetical protein [Lysinibacillus]KOS60884.1 hypothetical protein AN161_20090 [Lysinibacillus sp. FJAT-14222]QQP11565.1 hypothetical protein FJQ98_20570 [Lysinibacillus agricola]
MIDIKNKRMVTTRKAHTCFGCIEEIEKGESVVYVAAKEDEQRMNFHLHEECNKTIVKDYWFSGSGLYYGCIKDAKKSLEDINNIKFTLDEALPFSMMNLCNRSEA